MLSVKKTVVVLFMSLSVFFSYAQSCSYFPSDCPLDVSPMKDSQSCIGNFIVPQEITMQNTIRNLVTDEMDRIAESKKWEVYEYNESAFGVFVRPANGNEKAYPLPFNLRAPHKYILSYIVIVNNDSLVAWRNWRNTEMMDRANHITDSYNQSLSDPSFQETEKKYMDSADYWANQKAAYMTAHTDEYQKALLSQDQAGIKKFYDALKPYDARSNYWINKANEKNTGTMSGSEKLNEDFQIYRIAKTQEYRNSSILRIKFKFNAGDDIVSETGYMISVTQLSVPGSTLARQYHNDKPDEGAIFDMDQFSRSTDLAFILYGAWDMSPDKYKHYHASYTLYKKNTDKLTPKLTSCDTIQTISVHIEGSPYYIGEFMKLLESGILTSLIKKKIVLLIS